ncbi:MAG: DUF1318 domain-containing protein [Candidatus Omnitrophota bacterium]
MKKIGLLLALIAAIGCARVRVEAPKEAIKLDISMRLDIYQHIEKDIDAIENIVQSGDDQSSFMDYIVRNAYAEELDPEVEEAAYRRRDRSGSLDPLKAQGLVGENSLGILEVKGSLDPASSELVQKENADRMIIYKALAKKNNVSLEEIQKPYSKKLQDSSPLGTFIEVSGGWKVK